MPAKEGAASRHVSSADPTGVPGEAWSLQGCAGAEGTAGLGVGGMGGLSQQGDPKGPKDAFDSVSRSWQP